MLSRQIAATHELADMMRDTGICQGMPFWGHPFFYLRILLVILLVNLCACVGPHKLAGRMRAKMIERTFRALPSQPDPELVRQGMPAYLLMLDGLIAESPRDPLLLRAGALAYTQYCQSFFLDDDSTERARLLFERAHAYGHRLLRLRRSLAQTLDAGDLTAYQARLQRLHRRDTPDLFAVAMSWLGWIMVNSNSMDALSDLPWALALMDRLMVLNPDFGKGEAHLFYAIFYASQPNTGKKDALALSRQHFERAITLAGKGDLAVHVAYAEFYGKATLNEDFFTSRLKAVIASDLTKWPRHRLANELAVSRAKKLLQNRDEYF